MKERSYKHYTRGGQISFHNLRMWDQITKTLIYICMGIWLVLSLLLTYLITPFEILAQTIAYHKASLINLIGEKATFSIPFQGKTLRLSEKMIANHPYFSRVSNACLHYFYESVGISFLLSMLFGIALVSYFIYKGKKQAENRFIRGSILADCDVVKKQIEKLGDDSDIQIDGFPLIKHSEVQHMLVHGTVGTGKSQLIMKLLDALRKRGDRVIVYDKGCALLPRFLNESTDVILNPFDERCAYWDMWQEAPRDSDFENMAESLIPMHGESDPFWVNAARTVFASVASKMRHDKDRSIEKLLKLLLTGEFDHLEKYLIGTPAATLVSGKIEKTAISIRSVITTYLKSLHALTSQGLKEESQQEHAFCIRDYILDETKSGWLFISSNGEQHKSLKPLMSMWLAMASLTLLSLKEDRTRRIWFICDELPSLHKLPLLGETIAEVRKFGGCFLLGMQSFAQLTKVYGQSGASEIFDLLNTRFFFRSPSSDMARLVAKELGEEEIEESRENYSYGANAIRDGISLGTQRVTRSIVSYPQILELKDLHCFLRLPGHYPVTQLSLKLEERNVRHSGFIERIVSSKEHEDINVIDNTTTTFEGHEQLMTSTKKPKETLLDYMD